MLQYLANYEYWFGPLRLFDYVTFRAGGATVTAMLLVLLFGSATSRMLRRLNATAPTRLEGLVDDKYIDKAKDKTPSMGGLLVVAGVVLATLLWSDPANTLVLVFLGTLLSLAALGFIDDYSKVARGRRDGVSGKTKLLVQFAIAAAAVYLLTLAPQTRGIFHDIMVPFMKNPLWRGAPLAVVIVFGAVVVVSSSNAVNLTDGKDGLAIGCSIFCALTFAVFAYLCSHRIFAGYLNIPFIHGIGEVAVFAGAIAGAGIGFLWHNCHPASMFMGDTGSLPLGGTIGLLAVLSRQEFTLLIVGGVFVIEALSVIIQVASFKLTGKRVFLCTPIHHHFEQKGWTETQIVVRFWILSGVFALAALATLKLR